MMILAIILTFIIGYLIFSPKTKEKQMQNIKKLFYICLGIISFIILVRIINPLFALISGIIIVVIPFIDKILRLLSLFAIFKPIVTKFSTTTADENISESEACDILGVDSNATEEVINRAYRAKMTKYHPDKGGSVYFSRKLTQARDLLLKKRRRK